jgi:hypothetical protein
MSVPIELDVEGEGEALRLEGEVLVTVLARAFAPGAPVSFRATIDGQAIRLQAKTIGSKKRDDGRFDVRLRLTNLRREHRARLVAELER